MKFLHIQRPESLFDVFITSDDKIVLHHDKTLPDGRNIESGTYSQIKDYRLSNDEPLPLLEDYLEQGAKYPRKPPYSI